MQLEQYEKIALFVPGLWHVFSITTFLSLLLFLSLSNHRQSKVICISCLKLLWMVSKLSFESEWPTCLSLKIVPNVRLQCNHFQIWLQISWSVRVNSYKYIKYRQVWQYHSNPGLIVINLSEDWKESYQDQMRHSKIVLQI